MTTSQSVPLEEEEEDLRVLSTDITFGSLSGSDTRGPGLRSDSGEYNCFVNAIIQVSVSFKRFPFLLSQNKNSFSTPLGL